MYSRDFNEFTHVVLISPTFSLGELLVFYLSRAPVQRCEVMFALLCKTSVKHRSDEKREREKKRHRQKEKNTHFLFVFNLTNCSCKLGCCYIKQTSRDPLMRNMRTAELASPTGRPMPPIAPFLPTSSSSRRAMWTTLSILPE